VTCTATDSRAVSLSGKPGSFDLCFGRPVGPGLLAPRRKSGRVGLIFRASRRRPGAAAHPPPSLYAKRVHPGGGAGPLWRPCDAPPPCPSPHARVAEPAGRGQGGKAAIPSRPRETAPRPQVRLRSRLPNSTTPAIQPAGVVIFTPAPNREAKPSRRPPLCPCTSVALKRQHAVTQSGPAGPGRGA